MSIITNSTNYNNQTKDLLKAIDELNKRTRQTNELLCQVVKNTVSNTNSVVPEYDFELVCSSIDGRLLIQKFDTKTGIYVLLEIDGTTLVLDNSIASKCTSKTFDYEKLKVCVDGKTWTKILVFDTSVQIPTIITILWLNEFDFLSNSPNQNLIENENCFFICNAIISESYGDDISTLQPSHNFSIQKPNCCVVKVTTSAGAFTVQKGVGYYSTSDFNCLVTITAVEIISGTCTLDKIYIIGNKLK